MKLILSAMALAFAAPAFAQTAPAPVDHSKMDHSQHAPGHEQHKNQDQGKKLDCPMSKDGKKMACCDHDAHKAEAAKAHGDHGGH
jgi:Ni/Co efflux regulator RcnB